MINTDFLSEQRLRTAANNGINMGFFEAKDPAMMKNLELARGVVNLNKDNFDPSKLTLGTVSNYAMIATGGKYNKEIGMATNVAKTLWNLFKPNDKDEYVPPERKKTQNKSEMPKDTRVFERDEKAITLKQYLSVLKTHGVQVKNNFELEFELLPNISFMVSSITIPQITTNFAEVSYNGRKVDIPINFDYEHGITLTVLSDANGYFYTEMQKLLMHKSKYTYADSYQTATIHALTGDPAYKGMILVLDCVRIESISGLSFGHSENDVQTFDVNCKILDYYIQPGARSDCSYIDKTSSRR